MKRLLRWLIVAFILLGAAYAAATSFFGPGAEVRAAFERNKLAVMTGDRKAEAALLAPEVKTHFDRIRRHALGSDRATVATLPFVDRLSVFTMRRAVQGGVLRVDALRIGEPEAFCASARGALPMGDPAMAKWIMWVVLPVGPAAAWGVVDPTGMAATTIETLPLALFGPMRFKFVKVDGRWLIDTLPLLRSSASENEYYARMIEPTGNRFIFDMLKADPASVERLWQPLD